MAKKPSEPLAMLVNEVDALVVSQQEKKLAAVLNFTGPADDKSKEQVKSFGRKQPLKKVPLTIITDGKDLKVSDKAEVTVMIYRGKKVKFNYSLGKDGLNRKTVAEIIQNTKTVLAQAPEEPKDKSKEKPKANPAKNRDTGASTPARTTGAEAAPRS